MDSRNNFKDIDVSALDQILAEDMYAAELCPPGRNRALRRMHGVDTAIRRSIQRADYDDVTSPVPVVRVNPNHCEYTDTRERKGDEPIHNKRVIAYCIECNDPSSILVPFWLNCGPVIAQVDLCRRCAEHAMDELGGEPQIGLDIVE